LGEQLDFEEIDRSSSGRHPASVVPMKTLTVRIPESLFAEITRESVARKISKSEVIRQRLEQAVADGAKMPLIEELDDLEAFALMAQLLAVGRADEPMVEIRAEQSAA
jgi:hypothetical protein